MPEDLWHCSSPPLPVHCILPCLQVIFPERPGSLSRFLNDMCVTWNITLFHYRNTGNQESSVLVGLQVKKGGVCAACWGVRLSWKKGSCVTFRLEVHVDA